MDTERLEAFLSDLAAKGVSVAADAADELRVRAPKGAITPAMAQTLKDHKHAILRYLGHLGGGSGAPLPRLSLIFFASDDSAPDHARRYELFLEAARQADRAGFTAIWVPERHFHRMGGLFPNPAVAAASLAMVTRRIKIRAGSVVVPLHDPLRIAEEWAMVDNLAGGRVELSFASGWHVDDFVLAPDAHGDRKQRMFDGIDLVQRLWRGESVARVNGAGRTVHVATRPRPLQAELPVWITAVGNLETYEAAGQRSAHLLTCLLNQESEDLRRKIAAYRKTLAAHGGGDRQVAVFMHTFVGEEDAAVKQFVRPAFIRYLESSLDLVDQLLAGTGISLSGMDGADRADILDFAFERYYERRALFGTPATCRARLAQLAAAGVDEVACLVDFGLPSEAVLSGIARLALLIGAQADQLRGCGRCLRLSPSYP